mmetsp:Transcript_11381/g.22901  ORF Transcript_11381/g.22901 Transcript_11381/m.22901 type:complete len:201 (-) Transcript_11381:912-1514(-)
MLSIGSHVRKVTEQNAIYSPLETMDLHMRWDIIGWSRAKGGSMRKTGSAGSPPKARAARVSITRFTQSSCMSVSGKSKPINGPTNTMKVLARLMVLWNMTNLRIVLKMVRPYKIALIIELSRLSRITISEASFATSAPCPIAKDTSAFLRAALSLMPSPVIPTTFPALPPQCCATVTSLALSLGNARATTARRGKIWANF